MTIDCDLFVVKDNIIEGWYFLGHRKIASEINPPYFYQKGTVYLTTKKKFLEFLQKIHDEGNAYADTPTPEELADLPENATWQVLIS